MEIGITQETISAYLNGKAKPSADILIKLADYFNTSTDYILDRTNINIPLNKLNTSNLTDTEASIVNTYRKMSSLNKAKLDAYIQGLNDNH